jgi:hypothetical protein
MQSTAGAYLSQVSTSLSEYLCHYEASWLKLQKTTLELTEYEDRMLYSTWQISYDHAPQRKRYLPLQDMRVDPILNAENSDSTKSSKSRLCSSLNDVPTQGNGISCVPKSSEAHHWTTLLLNSL